MLIFLVLFGNMIMRIVFSEKLKFSCILASLSFSASFCGFSARLLYPSSASEYLFTYIILNSPSSHAAFTSLLEKHQSFHMCIVFPFLQQSL